jgi:hypothetical protein
MDVSFVSKPGRGFKEEHGCFRPVFDDVAARCLGDIGAGVLTSLNTR